MRRSRSSPTTFQVTQPEERPSQPLLHLKMAKVTVRRERQRKRRKRRSENSKYKRNMT
jgi:hypothetical protein